MLSSHFRSVTILVILGAIVVMGLSVLGKGERTIAVLENIHGIPFFQEGSDTIVTETLAHADIQLREAVVAKQLTLTISFIPRQVSHLSVGIRQDPFWLSYAPVDLYMPGDGDPAKSYTRTVTFPLTAAIQDRDRSIDMMFFADYVGGQEDLADKDTTLWTLQSTKAAVAPVLPSYAELKSYAKSVITREKPL